MELTAVLLICMVSQIISFGAGFVLGWMMHLSNEQGQQLAEVDEQLEQTQQYMMDEGYFAEELQD